MGDLDSEAINPIRDTVFMGNQGAYDLWGSLNMAVAGMCVPVTKSLSGVEGASKSILAKTAAKTVAREVVIDESVGFVSSNVANFAANQLDLNQTETLLLNMGLSLGLEKGVDTASAKISGKTTFADGMDVDDAKRYNSYWADVEAGTHTGHLGLTDADIRAWDFADSRVNEHLAVSEVDTNAVVKLRADMAASENSFINGGSGGGRKSTVLSLEEAENIAFDSIHGPDKADVVVLGKYGNGGPTAYTNVAKDMDAQYFQLDNWDELAAKYSEDEMWKINERFLDMQTSSGREIYLSHDPELYRTKTSFFSREIQYLENNGYRFLKEGDVWHAVR